MQKITINSCYYRTSIIALVAKAKSVADEAVDIGTPIIKELTQEASDSVNSHEYATFVESATLSLSP